MKCTPQAIAALHKKYAPSDAVFNLVFTHSQIVCDISMQLIAGGAMTVDSGLVRAGCLLHDIGVYPLFGEDGKMRGGVKYITHGIRGESILKNEGFPEAIWRFASHHTGVGLTKQDVINQNLPLPVEDYLAESDEELLIMYADKFHSKTNPPRFNSYESYKNDVAKFGEDKARKFEQMAIRFGVPDLRPFVTKYRLEIKG